MWELKRIFTQKKMIGFLIILIILNAFFYIREQEKSNWNESTKSFYEQEKEYRKIVQEYLELGIEDGIEDIRKIEDELTVLSTFYDYDAIIDHNTEMGEGFQVLKEELANEYPELAIIYNTNPKMFSREVIGDEIYFIRRLKEQYEYIVSYPDFLQSIKDNAENMKKSSIFSVTNSFSLKNIDQTVKDFAEMDGVSLELGLDNAIESLVTYKLTDYFMLGIIIAIIFQFLSERKKGLWNIVHATRAGRLRLSLNRFGVLTISVLFLTIILYGFNLLIGFSIYGGASDLNRMVQSVSAFMKYPVPITIAAFLIQFILLKFISFLLVGIAIWIAVSAVNNINLSVFAMALLLSTEYLLYTYLPVQSNLNTLKYLNLFSFIDIGNLYTYYLNLNIFGLY